MNSANTTPIGPYASACRTIDGVRNSADQITIPNRPIVANAAANRIRRRAT